MGGEHGLLCVLAWLETGIDQSEARTRAIHFIIHNIKHINLMLIMFSCYSVVFVSPAYALFEIYIVTQQYKQKYNA